MIRLQRLERIAYRLAVLLIFVSAARFGWVLARQQWQKQDAEKPTVGVSEHNGLPAVADLQRQLALPMASPGAIESAIAAAVGSSPIATAGSSSTTAPPRNFVKSYLSVQVGQARSELRVDGLLVGRTPYVGQIGCERGTTVKIDLLPPKGMPKHYEVPCLEGEMHLRDEP
jgi:hypothetical protein